MSNLTPQQQAAVESRGKVIVSASAGSGKTFVMIKKLVDAIVDGADVDEVLAVTFTKKAAAQMKDKLRAALIKKTETADAQTRARLKVQLAKIPSADISTIHSFCARLLRTYFYLLDIDGGFDIISSDDAAARDMGSRAMENLFDRLYAEDNAAFKLILQSYMRKRSDNSVKNLLNEAYAAVRSAAHYKEILTNAPLLYTEDGFEAVNYLLVAERAKKYERLFNAVKDFEAAFPVTKRAATYSNIFAEMKESINASAGVLYGEKPPLSATRKPSDAAEDKEAGESFKRFRESILKRYNALAGDFEERNKELEYFLCGGRLAAAFSDILLQYDREYTAVKREENKLDYNDLEHLTLELLSDESVKKQINDKYKFIFVDEYQDVNPVQEEIISALDGEVFLVGDVKQAIYGFRGSKSQFFTEKFRTLGAEGGTALRLSNNFRSAGGVLDFVNGLFSEIMTDETCGIDYAATSQMLGGGKYPAGDGEAKLLIFGEDEREEQNSGVYSVLKGGTESGHTREGLGVVALVKEVLRGRHFNTDTGGYVDTQPGDVCILTRKNKGGSVEGIVRALRDAGYSVSGVKEESLFSFPEVKNFLDILSLIDNAEQDIPLVTALLSPLGGLTEDELAFVKIKNKDKKEHKFKLFRECCRDFSARLCGHSATADKLCAFYEKLEKLRSLSDVLNTGELAGELLSGFGLELYYGAEKMKNIIRLVEDGAGLRLSEFLQRVKTGGDIAAPAQANADSIKVMSMHASKGLEFPVVIISDISRTFKGNDNGEILFDEQFGFAPRYFDKSNMLVHKTVLRRLVKMKTEAEELKNELNLFYVACTRAMNKLYILSEIEKPYDKTSALEARCYADLFDMAAAGCTELAPHSEFDAFKTEEIILSEPDEALKQAVNEKFMVGYKHPESVNLPVKSSASAILKTSAEDEVYAEHRLFGGEGETSMEKGIAYHRFLELCDFSVKDAAGIRSELKDFLKTGKIDGAQYELLDAEELAEIVSLPVFDGLDGCGILREQEFLCRMSAPEVLGSGEEEDTVLIQGAIDLLVLGKSGYTVIDYKYSNKSDEQLKARYFKQLALYKNAVAKIKKLNPETIKTYIVNIRRKSVIEL